LQRKDKIDKEGRSKYGFEEMVVTRNDRSSTPVGRPDRGEELTSGTLLVAANLAVETERTLVKTLLQVVMSGTPIHLDIDGPSLAGWPVSPDKKRAISSTL
jgi:hypothetical protein